MPDLPSDPSAMRHTLEHLAAADPRKLDALVAKVVLGCRVTRGDSTMEAWPGSSVTLPGYATTWEGLGLVVGRMLAMQFGFDTGMAAGFGSAAFIRDSGVSQVRGGDSPRSIAIAAILAVQEGLRGAKRLE